ncbi:hybrid sensor histidine kinase/response regulator [Bradyrhizobium japonicum]|uniref:hybrid sensor histidine kinase/response regulator n=1 Tax=Bradyrhizobium japonicum TaxID=375 RepID=UPI00209D4D7B|nr:PAS domain S-box protein [Bradyrhizobium japonicum]MCP1765469.1 PAS domain S-box-containing protein [Bradyrhizobium japonicum]MCP1787607.1 PAS domain S-box-containing protein [Bradyrhizobium japonicum]MCP1809483.1 PAS domain S-box-containing protein [Bradyrhizobium japonicum]MCP1818416.1 PAS domain S-box-containing protein [Bradyrhizobium japonicum]MCP1870074.1 PAS domain S-box-containing protein [Bradyrhizobium japonicum]
MENSDRFEAAQSGEGRYRLLVEAITDYAIYMLDRDGHVTSWNPGAKRFKGYEAEEIIGRHFSTFYRETEREQKVPALALEEAERTGRFEREGWRVRKDGTQFWAHVVIDAIRSPKGELVGFAKITRDLTERRAAEAKLRESEQQFRLMVQSVTDYAIYMLDVEGNVASWNAGAQRIKGYGPEEIIGRHFSNFYTEEDRAAGLPRTGLQTAAREGRWEHEGQRVRKDGTRFWAHVVIDAIRDDDGKLVGFAKVTRDITERREAEAALQAAQATLIRSQKLEAIGQLTGGVAHDFNNLLQVISGNLQLLSKDIAGNARAEMRVQSALAGVARGSKLATQLLAFARRQPLEPRVVNVGRLIKGMDELLRRAIGEEIEVETVVGGGLWNSLIDPDQLENAILNLAINARDAMNGEGRLTIEASNAFLDDEYVRHYDDLIAGQYVMIAVTDTGIGIPSDILERVYEPFFTTKAEGKGTGLGLAMVYGFLKQSGGHVKIYSEIGAGTTVKLYFPREMAIEDTLVSATSGDIKGGEETVLVVEDDDEVREVAVSMLSDLGYRVVKARDAVAALAIVDSGIPIDLIFTDVMMPGALRSPELARKAKERLPNVAVLFTSGYTQNAIVHGGRLDPGVELLAKPYTREALARKIRHVLANHAQRRVAQGSQHSANEKSFKDATVLLVEDDDLIRLTTTEMLNDLGCNVKEASTAQEALKILDEHPVDILLTDVGLPGVSGLELARNVYARRPDLCLVLATGDSGLKSEAARLGAILVVKPYTPKSLRQGLEQAMNKRR